MKLFIALILCIGVISAHYLHGATKNDISAENLGTLFNAIKEDDVHRVEELIKDQNVDTADGRGRTALHVAAEAGNDKIVDLLIQNGANVQKVDNEGVSALHFAALNNDEKVLDLLIKQNADVDFVNGADIKGNTPLHMAAVNSNEQVIEFLIEHGADIHKVNNFNITAIYWAAANMNEKVPELLIKKGVDVNNKSTKGTTPLHIAALNSNIKVAELLIKNGANVNAEDNQKWTPILAGINYSHETVRNDLESNQLKKERPYTQNVLLKYFGKHFTNPVEENASEKFVELLANNGADLNHQAKDHATPCKFAKEYELSKMVEVLEKHGAKC